MRRPPSPATRLAAAALAIVVVAACASSDDPGAAGTSDDVAASASTTAPSTTPTTVAVETSAPTTSEALDPGGDWCDAARAADAAGDALDALDFGDPAELERAVGDLLAATEAARDVVPDELAADVDVNVAALREFRDALAAVDYDFLEADLSILEDPDGRIQAATDAIERHNADVCGIPPDGEPADDPDDDSGDFDPTGGTLHDQIVGALVASGFTEAEAECLFAELDFTDRAVLDDEQAVLAAVAACQIDPERLLEGS